MTSGIECYALLLEFERGKMLPHYQYEQIPILEEPEPKQSSWIKYLGMLSMLSIPLLFLNEIIRK